VKQGNRPTPNVLASGELYPSDLLPGLRPWSQLGDFCLPKPASPQTSMPNSAHAPALLGETIISPGLLTVHVTYRNRKWKWRRNTGIFCGVALVIV